MWFVLCMSTWIAQEPAELAKHLAEMMSNSGKGITADSFIDTQVSLSDGKHGWTLVAEEQYFDGPKQSKGMLERHMLLVSDIDALLVQADTRLDGERNCYLVVRHRQRAGGIYTYKDGDNRKFGPLISFRLGVFTRKQVNSMKRDLERLGAGQR